MRATDVSSVICKIAYIWRMVVFLFVTCIIFEIWGGGYCRFETLISNMMLAQIQNPICF